MRGLGTRIPLQWEYFIPDRKLCRTRPNPHSTNGVTRNLDQPSMHCASSDLFELFPFPGSDNECGSTVVHYVFTYNVASESVLSVHVLKIMSTILSVTFQQLLGWVPYLWTAFPSTSFHAHPVSHKRGFCAPPDDSPVEYCIVISMLPDVCVSSQVNMHEVCV
jgi:hypothetical protein